MHKIYTEYESDKLLSKYIPVAKNKLVKSLKEIKVKKFPLVLKLISKKALHKSEIGAVKIIYSHEQLEKEFKRMEKLGKRISMEGILIQEYMDGQNFIIGLKKDETFGHIILFGMGGILTEL